MKQEITRQIVKVGNSAGVILPREWLSGTARIELIEKPVNIKKEVFEILEPYLEEVLGVYLVGSYARGEQTNKSDVDLFVITSKINKSINVGKYSILLISKDSISKSVENNALPLIPMLKEAQPILNANLLEIYENLPLTRKNLRPYVELGESAMKINKGLIELDKELESLCGDAVAYSLVLNLRSAYIVDCLIKNKIWNTKGLISLVKSVSGSKKAYEGYLRRKENKKEKEDLPVEEAEMLLDYVLKKIGEHKRWIEKRG